jgi:hypothetical protein
MFHMPIVKRDARYVTVAYELLCGAERATALAADLSPHFKDDDGFHSAEDDTRGWDGDRMSVVVVTYNTLADAVRLDARVRSLLSRTVDYTYEPHYHTSYGSRGATGYVTASTSVSERE